MARAACDVVVLGIGTCGEDLSLRLLRSGLRVVGIEASLVGGECPYYACLPTKMMIRAANLLYEARRVDGMAGTAQITPDWKVVVDRIRAEATGGWDDSVAVDRFERHGGRLIHGRGRFTGPRTITVGGESFSPKRGIVIATGSTPVIPPIRGLDEVAFWTTRDVIRAETLPASIVIIGGGAVGCEFAQVLARFGVAVTIVEAGDRLLHAEEPEASEVVEAAFLAEGIQIHTGVPVERVSSRDGSTVVTLGGGEELRADRLLVAVGRRVDLAGLGLEATDIPPPARFLEVDERMRVADGIWAMGDVTGKAMFTHVALYQSAIVAADLLGEPAPGARYDAVPRVTFTDPEVAVVGMTESQALEAGVDATVVVKQLAATFRGWLHGATAGFVKLVVDRVSGTIVGATVAGPRGGEMLGPLSLAVHARVPVAELQHMIYPFPTFFGGIGETVGAYGRGLANIIDPMYRGHECLDEIAAKAERSADSPEVRTEPLSQPPR